MMTLELPQFVRDLLGCCPTAGDGVNTWLFRCARVLHAFRAPAEIADLLLAAAAGCGRTVTREEIGRAVQNSRDYPWKPDINRKHANSKWPAPNIEQIEAIVNDGPKLVDLWENSPIRFEDNGQHTEDVIDTIFPGNPLLCAAETNYDFCTRDRGEWRGTLAKMALIVPSPMSARTGLTKEGKVSGHTLDNTGLRRFLVSECDFSVHARDGKTETPFAPLLKKLAGAGIDTLDIGAAILWHLGQRAPLALAVHSGGKSLHGWFFCAGQTEERLQKFMRYAVSIGADPATWTRSQFVRMPDGTRQTGERQSIFFFNPSVLI